LNYNDNRHDWTGQSFQSGEFAPAKQFNCQRTEIYFICSLKKYHPMTRILFILLFISIGFQGFSQSRDQAGAWYMYFWNTTIKESGFGFQGDVQFRNWNLGGDLEQLLLRGGLTYSPKGTKAKFTAGYGYILSGGYTLEDASTSDEHRIYQEALLPHKIGSRVYLTHRYRFEQRFVKGQDFRMRMRYNLFVTVPFNKPNLEKGSVYAAIYNEVFVNTSKNIGNGKTTSIFDRNRLYGAIGYHILDNLKIQLGYMHQSLNSYSKGQAQLSVHHKF
jgi:hypothetical protein